MQSDISPPLPFPQRFKEEQDKQYQQFLNKLKQLQTNIFVVDALVQISNYGKFMKELLSKKKKLSDMETIALTEGRSALLTNKLPHKMKDPGSFTIPCSIGDHYLDKPLCDLGASINLMPLSTFRKLGIGHMKPTSADKEVPIILERPFLATVQTLIDVYKGELTMQLNDEHVTFRVFESIQVTSDDEFVDDCDSMVEANNIELKHGRQIESLDLANRTAPIFKPSINEAPTVELKPLPTHLK
ncbi:uncharacterized protein [Gossypium hirsutum]|uniref:Uncharacterized protein n=1 Tax=Gossypium hirsutum TaxID=3635 RepID=A0A1U8PQY5_GOSHI|nr:uncharacterized protein LOC107961002 [Gossypium hirsutum]